MLLPIYESSRRLVLDPSVRAGLPVSPGLLEPSYQRGSSPRTRL